MPSAPLSALPHEMRERVRKDVRGTLQFHRDLARGTAAAKAAKFIVSRGGVQPGTPSAEQFEAEVEDAEGTEQVALTWAKPGDIRCGCATMKRLGTCAHALAVLEVLFAELHKRSSASAPPAGSAGPASTETKYLSRLESLGARLTQDRKRAVRAAQAQTDPWSRAAHRGEEVRYVLRFAERGDAASFRLEAQARPRGDDGAWRSVPMAVEATSDDEALAMFGPEHAAVAAIASGAPDAEKLVSSALHRTVALAYVDRVLAPALLGAAERAGALLVRAGAGSEPRPLELDLAGVARLEVVAVENATPGAWTLTGRLALPSGALVALQGVLAVSTDGVIAVATSPTSASLALLDAPGARHVIDELRQAPLVVPHEDGGALAAIAGVSTLADDSLRQAAHPIRPFPCLRVDAPLHAESTSGAARGLAMRCTLEFDYGGTRVPFDSIDEVVPSLDGRVVARDREMEDRAIARFFDLGGERTGPDIRAAHDASVSGARFEGMVGTLLDEGWQVVAEDRLLKAATSVNVSVASGVDWFELAGGVTFGEEEIPFPEILRAAQARRGYVTLGDGSRGMLPDRWLERWRVAAMGEATDDDTVRFDQDRAWALAGMLDGAEDDPTAQLEADRQFKSLRANLSGLTKPGPKSAPASFQGELRPYQREGLGWLTMLDEVGLCGCLADDMGLGKTVQLLAYLAHRRETGPGGRALVVAPRSLVFNWLAEAERFVPDVVAVDFSGSNRWRRFEEAPDDALLVTTYGSMRRDAERLLDTEFDLVVLDEAQAIKTADSQTSRAAKMLRARRRVSLTGTPIENHLGDLWSQLDFLNPGMLGASAAFERLGATREAEDLLDEGRDLLSRALRPILLRRTKESVLHDLPPKTEQVLRAPLTGAQRTAYDSLADHYRKELTLSKREKKEEGEDRPELNVLAALTRLRQAACHPGLIDKTLIPERSGKVDLVLPMLEGLVRAGSKALVFSSFTGLLGLVRTRLETLRIPYLLLDGTTKDRGSLVERFQKSDEAMVFLISIKAGGAGLNLTAADYVFLLDPWWNPAVEAQAIDRAHRIGRTRPVHVYRVLTEETVEAKVVELQERKRALAGDVLSGAASSASGIGRSDLGFLLGG